MNYIVIDLEWNQSKHIRDDMDDDINTSETKYRDNNLINSESSDRNSIDRKTIEKNMPFEIIEIGAVKLDESFNEVDKFSRLIKPVFYKKMSHIITDLTGITDKDLQNKKGFKAVAEEFLNWCGDEYIMCTFGNQDIYELGINMYYHNMEIPWKYPMYYIDVQKLFGIMKGEESSQRSLEMVSMYMGIPQKKSYHRALTDAVYTAEVLKKISISDIFQYKSLDYTVLPEDRFTEKESDLKTHLEYLTSGFKTRDELIDYKELFLTRCPVCMKKCKKKIKWFIDGSKYLCAAKCDNHGMIEGNIYIKKNHNGYYGIRKTWTIDEKRLSEIINKREIIKEKRKQRRNRENK